MIIQKIKSLLKINFVKDTATLQVGTFVSTGLAFIASVVFARFLGPENYGLYGLIFAFTTLIGVFKDWGEGYATLTLLSEAWAKKDKDEIKRIIIFYIKISAISCFTVGLVAIIIAPYLSKIFYQNEFIGQMARLIIFAGCIQFLFLLIGNILQASRKIKHLTILENINKTIYIILPISFVIVGLGLRGIIWGYFLTALLFFIFSVYFYRVLYNKTKLLPTFTEIIKEFRKTYIKKYFKFGFPIAISKNLSSLYTTLPIIFLGMFVNSAEIGYYKIAFSYIGLSLIFLKPISRLLAVQLPRSKVAGIKELKKHFYKTALYSFVGMVIIIIPILILSKFLVQFFYGTTYLASVDLIYILWPYVLISATGVGLGALFRSLDIMKVSVKINFINIIIGAPICYLLIKNYGLVGMVITTILWQAVSIAWAFIYINKYFKNHDKI